jgi:membrane protein
MESIRRLGGRLAGWVLALPPIATARVVFQVYGDAGGGLIASGLAYAGLFAILAAILFAIGVLGYVVREPDRLTTIVTQVASQVPPLSDLVRTGLEKMAESATPFSIIGLVGLAWGASRFYGALDDAFARVYRDEPARGFLARALRGIILIVVLLVVLGGAVASASVSSFVETFVRADSSPLAFIVWRVLPGILGVGLFLGAVAAVLRWVPPRPPSWRALWLPAIVVAIVLWAFTTLFVLIQARLVGALEVFSGFAFVLATMIWLSTGFQALLLGASWTRVRDEPAHVESDMRAASVAAAIEKKVEPET